MLKIWLATELEIWPSESVLRDRPKKSQCRVPAAGALEGIDAIFGLHVWPSLASGTLGSRAGALMGACQQFQVTIKGRGGHAAMPHTVIDPIVASSHVILALQVPPSP